MNTVSLSELESTALTAIAEFKTLDQLEQFRVAYLGKKGLITAQLKRIGSFLVFLLCFPVCLRILGRGFLQVLLSFSSSSLERRFPVAPGFPSFPLERFWRWKRERIQRTRA